MRAISREREDLDGKDRGGRNWVREGRGEEPRLSERVDRSSGSLVALDSRHAWTRDDMKPPPPLPVEALSLADEQSTDVTRGRGRQKLFAVYRKSEKFRAASLRDTAELALRVVAEEKKQLVHAHASHCVPRRCETIGLCGSGLHSFLGSKVLCPALRWRESLSSFPSTGVVMMTPGRLGLSVSSACVGTRLWPPSQSRGKWPLSLTALEESAAVVGAGKSIGSAVRRGLHATVLVPPPGQPALPFVCKDQLSPRRASAIRPYRSVDHGSRGGARSCRDSSRERTKR